MACKTSYELHHNFPKLAEESGFTFNTHRSRTRTDWDKIRLVNLDAIIKDRRFFLVEQHINDILECVLESEFDLRVLDEGVVKLFRLAQLAVEYQQFCRHYLDRSVYVLREEIKSLAQELDESKKTIREKEDDLRRLRKRHKQSYTSPFGGENITNLILRTLSNKDIIFPSTSKPTDTVEYNKCNFCEKVFLNQIYLKNHVSRRHANEIPEKDSSENIIRNRNEAENKQITNEIFELKQKLQTMQKFLNNMKVEPDRCEGDINHDNIQLVSEENLNMKKEATKVTTDSTVATNNEKYLLDKFEEWRKEEEGRYSKEMGLLRSQIIESMKSFNEKNNHSQKSAEMDNSVIEQLNTIIEKQNSEIYALKEELRNTKMKIEEEQKKRKVESDSQMMYWNQRTELQTKQYESLLKKLDEVSREAKKSKEEMESERNTASQLQEILNRVLEKKGQTYSNNVTSNLSEKKGTFNTHSNDVQISSDTKSQYRPNPSTTDRKIIEDLHRTAQELLNEETSSSDEPSLNDIKINKKLDISTKSSVLGNITYNSHAKTMPYKKKSTNIMQHVAKKDIKLKNTKIQKSQRKYKSCPNIVDKHEEELVSVTPTSPSKVVRAKITEMVNNKLISMDADPFKGGISHSIFRKYISYLQGQQEVKMKKNPALRVAKHSILAYLDSVTKKSENMSTEPKPTSSPKQQKTFNFISMISNVKNKASRKKQGHFPSGRPPDITMTPSETRQLSPLPEKNIRAKSSLRSTNKIEKGVKRTEFSKSVKLHTDTSSSSESSKLSESKLLFRSSSNSIDNLIKSPVHRPTSANSLPIESKLATNVRNELFDNQNVDVNKSTVNLNNAENSSDDVLSLVESPVKQNKFTKERVVQSPKQTKGVLKHAASTSSLNKKKVFFDMDAIEMKSVSASPSQSQSITEKSEENNDLGILNLEDEEWDISSIENEPGNTEKNEKSDVSSKMGTNVAQLKKSIEFQLSRRGEMPSTFLKHGVDVFGAAQVMKVSSVGGSNTSLGSSVLDDSDNIPETVNNKTLVKTKMLKEKNVSHDDLSDISIDKILSKHIDSF